MTAATTAATATELAASPVSNSYLAVGIATREKERGRSPVAMAFARSAQDFRLLPKHRERLVELSLLHHPYVIDEMRGYFKSVKLRTREGGVQGNMHLCSCAYPVAKARTPWHVAPKVIQPSPEPEEELVLPTASERAQLFDIMDRSGDGVISEREFVEAVSIQWPQFNNEKALKIAMHTADASEDGSIGRKEFALLLEYLVFFNNLWSSFSALDSEGDGHLGLEEFKRGCKLVGNKLTTTEAEIEFTAMDFDGTGEISFAEFARWSARRLSEGLDDKPEIAAALRPEDSADSSASSHDDMPSAPPRTPTPPLRAASGRRVRVPELASGRMTRLPLNDQAQEAVRPTHFTVWMITKSSNTANIYPHLRNLAHAFMRDSSDLTAFLRVHREWLAGDLNVYDSSMAIAPPEGAMELLIPVEKKPKQTSLFASSPLASTSSRPDHSLATPRHAQSPRSLPRSDSLSKSHTPRGQEATRTKRTGRIHVKGEENRNTKNEQATEEVRRAVACTLLYAASTSAPNRKAAASMACVQLSVLPRTLDLVQAQQTAAAILLQARVRGMLARTVRVKVAGGVVGMKKDSVELQRARERRHLWQTRREIAVIDWPQELRRAAIAADLNALREALKHLSTDTAGANVNAATEAGMTALHYACCAGKDELVLELLEAGADPRLRTRRAWPGGSGTNADGVEKTTASRSVQQATTRVEKTPADYARQNKMFTMQKLCEQRAYAMHREDERMAMLRRKQEIEMRFGAPRSTKRGKYKVFSLKDTAASGSPRSSNRVIIDSQGQRVALPPALTVPERHSLALQKYMAHQRVARQLKRPSRYPQFGLKEEIAQKR